MIAVDLPGFGASPLRAEPIAIAGYARFLARLCDALGVDRPIVVGNSMGGHIAAELAIAEPQRVQRLVLVSPAGASVADAARQMVLAVGRGLALTGRWSASRVELLASRPALRRLLLGFVCEHPELLSAPIALELMRGSGKPAFLPALQAVLSDPVEERLSEIACPTLLVWGRNDRVIPVRDAKAFGRAIPDLRTVILPDTGHVAMLERPARFHALLEEFLAEGASVAPSAADALGA